MQVVQVVIVRLEALVFIGNILSFVVLGMPRVAV
jgi:hypothetical protein